MLKNSKINSKNGFYIWFDRKYKKEYYVTELKICKTKFINENNSKYLSVKLENGYVKGFNNDKPVYYASSDILNPFEENYGMFLINFLNADFSNFETAYFTFFCFYGILLEEYSSRLPNSRFFKSERKFKLFYEKIFDIDRNSIKKVQNLIKHTVNYSYNLKGITDYKDLPAISRFITYSIKKNLFKYSENINVYYNINYAYNTNEISIYKDTPIDIKHKIETRIINTNESNIFNSSYISNLVFVALNEIVTNPKVSIGICKNCGKYFISYQKKPDKYCRITYSENEEICKDVGIQIAYKKKQKDNPCLTLYRKTYQKKLMYAKRSGDENVKESFKE